MKVHGITDVEAFFSEVDRCKGKVELVTVDGDRLNLRSKLCQYVSVARLFSGGETTEMEIVTDEEADERTLKKYLLL
jgi:hypothetical protein